MLHVGCIASPMFKLDFAFLASLSSSFQGPAIGVKSIVTGYKMKSAFLINNIVQCNLQKPILDQLSPGSTKTMPYVEVLQGCWLSNEGQK